MTSATCRRCDWRFDPTAEGGREEQAAAHSLAASHPLCVVCHHSLAVDEVQTCEGCLTDTRATLSGIVTMWADLPSHLGHARAQRYDSGPRGGEEHHLPGGTVFALLAPGSAGGAPRRLTATDVDRGLDGREHVADERADESPSVQWLLASWAQDWSEIRQDGAYSDLEEVR